MRPVERGSSPGVFTQYQDARDPLVSQIGDYCSYCENALHSEVDVEHVRPKSLHPADALNWSNFLLACSYCNSIKGNRPITLADYYWPDTDNTCEAFKYGLDQAPTVADGLSAQDQAKARRTLDLTGLDRDPAHPRYSDRDRRWRKRKEVWGVALLSLQQLRSSDNPHMRQSIVFTALSRGFWSVWMTVFHNDLDMRQRLIAAFPGTATGCFGQDAMPVRRPPSS